ncbi:MAG TPA: carbamoyltransferase N-terminal domain-containing protein [Candidatus Acidoferrum sp.]
MNVLGISCYYHDSAAALLQDGLLVAAAQEERFSRIKNDPSFPLRAIQFCLARGGIKAQELDYVVLHEKPMLKLERFLTSALAYWPKSGSLFQDGTISWMKKKLWIRAKVTEELGVPREKILFVEHHLSHAASSFFCSPFSEAAVLTVDGVGEWATATTGTARSSPGQIKLTHEMRFPNSLGLFYSAFTSFLGFEVNEGEYKVMGMAPYGEPRYLDRVEKVAQLFDDGSLRLEPSYFAYQYSSQDSFSHRFVELFGTPRNPRSEFVTGRADTGKGPEESMQINQYYADIAASVQQFTERALVKMATQLQRSTGAKNLCFAGGVALNSVANTKLLRGAGFDQIFIQPAAGDAGAALGAALYAWHVLLGKPRAFVMEHAFWGQNYGDAEVDAALSGVGARELAGEDELISLAVEDLAAGKVLGWFQGRFEWGPRALGNRSILADPRREDMKKIVNRKIKFREPFRPFAPVVPESCLSSMFDGPDSFTQQYPSRFMLMVVPWKEEVGQRVPAVNHLGTGRVQSMRKEWNPLYYSLMESFGAATGVPVLLNTSFNVRGEPIVSSPQDALRTFQNSGLDVLYAENYRLEKANV